MLLTQYSQHIVIDQFSDSGTLGSKPGHNSRVHCPHDVVQAYHFDPGASDPVISHVVALSATTNGITHHGRHPPARRRRCSPPCALTAPPPRPPCARTPAPATSRGAADAGSPAPSGGCATSLGRRRRPAARWSLSCCEPQHAARSVHRIAPALGRAPRPRRLNPSAGAGEQWRQPRWLWVSPQRLSPPVAQAATSRWLPGPPCAALRSVWRQ